MLFSSEWEWTVAIGASTLFSWLIIALILKRKIGSNTDVLIQETVILLNSKSRIRKCLFVTMLLILMQLVLIGYLIIRIGSVACYFNAVSSLILLTVALSQIQNHFLNPIFLKSFEFVFYASLAQIPMVAVESVQDNRVLWVLLSVLVTFTALSAKLLLNEVRFFKRVLQDDTSSKEVGASWFSILVFSYLDDLLAIGLEKPLDHDDLDSLVPGDQSRIVCAQFERISKPNRSLAMNLFVLVQRLFLVQQVATLISVVMVLCGPYLLRLILLELEKPQMNVGYVILLSVSLFVLTIVRSVSQGQLYNLGRRIGLRIKAVIMYLVYRKSLKRIQPHESGTVTNLISIDAAKILEVCSYLIYLWSTPVEVLLFVGFLVYVAGVPGISGVVVMVLMIPLGGYIARIQQHLQQNLMKNTDTRITAVNEFLNSIRVVKFFAWESRFEQKVEMLRESELKSLWGYMFLNATNQVLWNASPVFVSFFTFYSMTVLFGGTLSVSTAFTCLSIFQGLRNPLQDIPDIIVKVLEAGVSLRRVEAYLDQPELSECINTLGESTKDIVRFLPGSLFKWSRDVEGREFVVEAGLEFPMGQLSIVHGPTGAGKSSLISALLGELECIQGGVVLCTGVEAKSKIPIGYVSQSVWLQNATIRENILFGEEWDQQRYNKTIEYCALVRDFETLDAGDNTEVGEKGVNLSGGQKARISLARAVYSKAEILLLDDVLSAVDAPTAKQLFEQAICGPLMKNRTRILVTHAVHLCLSKAHLAVQMNGGQTIVADEPLLKKLVSTSTEFDIQEQVQEEKEEKEHKIIEAESRMIGSVSGRVYWQYCIAAGGIPFVVMLTMAYTAVQSIMLFNDVWIKYWADAFERQRNDPTVDVSFYAYMYAAIGFSTVLALFVRVYMVSSGSLHASRFLHHKLTSQVLGAPIRFFEKTPIGRIINRFSKDMKDVDLDVAYFTGDFLSNLVRMVFYLVVILTVNPLALGGFIPVSVMYVFVGRRYLAAARELKRLDSNSRSPVFSHFGESIQGAATIRAYAREEQFIERLHDKVDVNHQAFSLMWVMNRWLGVRVEFMGAFISLSTTLGVIFSSYYFENIDPGFAGLSIAYSLGFTDALLWVVRLHAMMEMEMNAVERIDEYMQLEQEPLASVPHHQPPHDWPAKGEIKVKELTLSYSAQMPPVLSKVSFEILAGEKVGIVGRTGAGKTTLSLAFFRFMEADEGSIFIDGLDIAKMGLHDLRSKLTVIPQDPVLFSGTLRSNLDPFGEYEDQELWGSLKAVHFLDSFLTDGLLVDQQSSNLSLDDAVMQGGTNYSQGQRQLLCLARAILKRSKVIILDEATASIDHLTDVKIQHTIRKMFTQSTLLCIAHRLSTIMDYDKILVLNKGQVSQFGKPVELIHQDGIFKQMCLESNEFEKLVRIATTRTME